MRAGQIFCRAPDSCQTDSVDARRPGAIQTEGCLLTYRKEQGAMDLTNRCCPNRRRKPTNWKCSVTSRTSMNQTRPAAAVAATDSDGDNGDSQATKKTSGHPQVSTVVASTGKENLNQCHECNGSLAKSKHLVSISGQTSQWHSECFKCNMCQKLLDQEISCHIYKNKVLCRDDYSQLQRNLATKCSRCHWPIGASDWVRRASQYVYHLACFSCDICQRQLSTGEQFTIRIQKRNVVRLLCRLHFAIETTGASALSDIGKSEENDQSLNKQRTLEQKPTGGAETTADIYLHLLASTSGQQAARDGSRSFPLDEDLQVGHLNHGFLQRNPSSRLVGPVEQQFQLNDEDCTHREQLQLRAHNQSQTNNSNSAAPSTSSSDSSMNGHSNTCHSLASLASKSKRVRTTFTEDQLSILQNHFQIDSNPDGQDLERIAVITGLTKRVTQVWFQNSRARQKKYMTKRKPPNNGAQQQQQQTSGSLSRATAPCSDMQQYVSQQQSSIGGSGPPDCFAKINDINSVAHQWLANMAAGGPVGGHSGGDTTTIMSSSMSSQGDDDESRLADADESRSGSSVDDAMIDDDDLVNIRDGSTSDTTIN